MYLEGKLEVRAIGHAYGSYWEDHFSGALCYANDLTLAPLLDALKKMPTICEEYIRIIRPMEYIL